MIRCGDCTAHIGTSSKLQGRLRTLARLGTHRGSAEVLCASFCTQEAPQVWWRELSNVESARASESALKRMHGEPPVPRERYYGCVNGVHLMKELIKVAGKNSWEAGYIEAVFEIGEKLNLLFGPRFRSLWKSVGVPPGPWAELLTRSGPVE